MLPCELKFDKEGLLYTNDRRILKQKSLFINPLNIDENKYYQYGFFHLFSTNEYIVKYSYNPFFKEDLEKMKNMLITLIDKQSSIPNVDFPIGYFRKYHKLAGLIIKYYPNGVSCNRIIENGDLEGLGKYYYHDEESLHNLFLMFRDVLNLVYEMFENGVYYTDIHPGNIVLDNNKVKIIDFDPKYVYFNNKDILIKSVMYGYYFLLKSVIVKKYHLLNDIKIDFNDFETAKVYTRNLEDEIRLYRR